MAWLRGEPASSSVHVQRWQKHLVHAHSALRAHSDEQRDAKKSKLDDINIGAVGSFDKMMLTDAVEGKCVFRFPPEPSGFLHMGHGKAVLLNDYYRQLYKGQLIVRFDDTNPAKEKSEYCTAILEDLASLGVKPDRVTYSSDNFPFILEQARRLIVQGDAYVVSIFSFRKSHGNRTGLKSAFS